MAAILLVPLFLYGSTAGDYWKALNAVAGSAILVIGCVVVGALYNIFKLRDRNIAPSMARISDNIIDRLVGMGEGEPDLKERVADLRSSRKVVSVVFYGLVDSNPTLTVKSQNIFMNGLFLSTTADFCSWAQILTIVYLVAALLTLTWWFGLLAFALAISYLVAHRWVLPRVEERHIELGNEQLDYIEANMRADACDRLRGLLDTMAH